MTGEYLLSSNITYSAKQINVAVGKGYASRGFNHATFDHGIWPAEYIVWAREDMTQMGV